MKKYTILVVILLLCGCSMKSNTQKAEIILKNGKPTTFKGEQMMCFERGEEITIILKNTGSKPLTLPNTAPWIIYRIYNTTPVYQPIAAQVLVKLNPNETIKWTWDQRDYNGNTVDVGLYKVVIRTFELKLYKKFVIAERCHIE